MVSKFYSVSKQHERGIEYALLGSRKKQCLVKVSLCTERTFDQDLHIERFCGIYQTDEEEITLEM